MGISVAVDDFGTGYSNLSYLIDFPFHKLKIDRSFVSRMETDSSSGAVVSTIVGLSRALGVKTIAEGVETENQATLLRAAGCEDVQGYLYGRPAPLASRTGSSAGRDAARPHQRRVADAVAARAPLSGSALSDRRRSTLKPPSLRSCLRRSEKPRPASARRASWRLATMNSRPPRFSALAAALIIAWPISGVRAARPDGRAGS